MNKLKWMMTAFVFVIGLQSAFAQPNKDVDDGKRREKIEALKRAYLTEKLELTVPEAEKFWPLYNANDKQKTEIRKSLRERHKSLSESAKTEKDAIAAIEFITQKRKEEADLDAKFFRECLPVIGLEKAIKLANAERDFQHEVMRSYKNKGGDKGDKGSKGDKGPKGPK